MFTVDFWFPVLYKIDGIKEDFVLTVNEVKELSIIEGMVFDRIHTGNKSEEEYTILNSMIGKFRNKLMA